MENKMTEAREEMTEANGLLCWSLFNKSWMASPTESQQVNGEEKQIHIGERTIGNLRGAYDAFPEYYINELNIRQIATRFFQDNSSWVSDIYHFNDSIVDLSVDAQSGVVNEIYHCPKGIDEETRRKEFYSILELEGLI